MIEVTPQVKIDERELQLEYVRGSGPGGQNVNKVATAAQLRWDVRSSPSLSPEVKERLARLAGSRMTAEGVLIIEARRYRTQEQNRQDALDRLVALVQKAAEPPRSRKPTRPSGAARARRLQHKRKKGEIKQLRRSPKDWED